MIREGGNLVNRSVLYHIEPNGPGEFFGSTDILEFAPGETKKNATILTIADKIPEVLFFRLLFGEVVFGVAVYL